MALQISQFAGVATLSAEFQSLPGGEPTTTTTASPLTFAAGTVLIRIDPQGGKYNITWVNGVVEQFSAVEYRMVKGGTQITFAAA